MIFREKTQKGRLKKRPINMEFLRFNFNVIRNS